MASQNRNIILEVADTKQKERRFGQGKHLGFHRLPGLDSDPSTILKTRTDLKQAGREEGRGCCTMRFASTAKVLAKCKLKYYRISECVGEMLGRKIFYTPGMKG